jgi:hypothetical protein
VLLAPQISLWQRFADYRVQIRIEGSRTLHGGLGGAVPPRQTRRRTEAGYRLVVEVTAIAKPEEDNGWTVLATTVSTEAGADAEILQAYQEQNTTVESGFRWIKNPAAITPVWLEKPERIAALAMLTVLGLLVSSVIQRQVRLYLRTHDQQLPGNKGLTATPTAAASTMSPTRTRLPSSGGMGTALWGRGDVVAQVRAVGKNAVTMTGVIRRRN